MRLNLLPKVSLLLRIYLRAVIDLLTNPEEVLEHQLHLIEKMLADDDVFAETRCLLEIERRKLRQELTQIRASKSYAQTVQVLVQMRRRRAREEWLEKSLKGRERAEALLELQSDKLA